MSQRAIQNADSESQKRQRWLREREEQQLRDALATVLASPAGRRVLGHLIFDGAFCALDQEPFQPSALIYVNVGRQQVGRALMAWCQEQDLEGYRKLVNERLDIHAGRKRFEPPPATEDSDL